MLILAQSTGATVTIFAAFAAGLLSFASPCVLPLVPGYLSAVSGGELAKPPEERRLGAVLAPASAFCLSFIAVFVALGLFATGIGAPLQDQRRTLEVIAGALLILMGAIFVLTPIVPRLNRTLRPEALLERAGNGGPFAAGAAFAIAWTPCTGPILGAILTTAATRGGVGGGAFLLLAYGVGLAVPFMVAAMAFERVTGAMRVIRDHYTTITVVSGVILIGVGLLVANGEMTRLAAEARELMSALGLDPVRRAIER